jgi:transaldolase
MAASFRNINQIRELAGCDKITIGPKFLEELAASTDDLPRKLSPESAGDLCEDEVRGSVFMGMCKSGLQKHVHNNLV